MKTTGSWFSRFVRTGLLAGVGVTSTTFAAGADDTANQSGSKAIAAQPVSTRAPLISTRVINTMVDDAMRDGALDAIERVMILDQASRMFSAAQVAELEGRLNKLPVTASAKAGRPSASTVRLGTPVELGAPSLEPVSAPKDSAVKPVEAISRSASPAASPTTQASYAQPAEPVHAAPSGSAPSCSESCSSCQDSCSTGFFDNMYMFGAIDSWRGPLDGDQSNNFGARIGFNGGMPLWEQCGIGAQFGMSYGAYDYKGRFDLSAETETASVEEQLFFTAGLFKHCDLSSECSPDRISWGLVYDRMFTDNTSAGTAELSLGQFRGQIGYACDEFNEVGLWGSITDTTDDSFNVLNTRHTTRSIDQLNVYWRHKWCTLADTRAFVGIAEDPGSFIVGANGQMPLNNYWALFGGFQYIVPSAGPGDPGFRDEFWNLTAGIAFYPGGNAITRTVCGNCWTPLLPVADNGSFAADLGF